MYNVGATRPALSQRVDDTFRKAQTERRATQLLTPGEGSSPSQLDQPSRRGYGAVPSRWASTVVPGTSGAKKRLAAEPRARRSRLTNFFCSRQDHNTPYFDSLGGAAHAWFLKTNIASLSHPAGLPSTTAGAQRARVLRR